VAEFDFEKYIVDVVDYPKPGVVFKDITPILASPEALSAAVDAMAEHFAGSGVTKIVGAEARGFIFGAVLAYKMGVGFVPARKPGKLPRETFGVDYVDEYATNRVEMHLDSLTPSDKVLIVDDLIATGGTARACSRLVKHFGAEVIGYAFLLELSFFHPRDIIAAQDGDVDVYSLVKVDGK
jgi:adenine phosphoribosyltransferase